jgi:hypothetical protein
MMCSSSLARSVSCCRLQIDAIWGWNEKTHQFAFKAVRDIPANTVIHTTYGARGNSDLLVHYGFTLPHNPFNSAGLCLAASKDDFGFQLKQKMLEEIYGNGDRENGWNDCSKRLASSHPAGYHCRLHSDLLSDASQECFQFARVAVSSAEQFAKTLQPAHEDDLRDKESKVAAGEDPEESKWSVLQIEPWDLMNEVKAVQMMSVDRKHAT